MFSVSIYFVFPAFFLILCHQSWIITEVLSLGNFAKSYLEHTDLSIAEIAEKMCNQETAERPFPDVDRHSRPNALLQPIALQPLCQAGIGGVAYGVSEVN